MICTIILILTLVNCQEMYSKCCFFIIFLLFQCSQGALRRFDTIRHVEESREFEDIEIFKKHPNGDNNVDQEVDELSRIVSRARRQNARGDPEAYSTSLSDSRQYARLSYLGENSKVNTFVIR